MIDWFLELINKVVGKDLKKSYLEVVKKFPNIPQENISIIYKPTKTNACIKHKGLDELIDNCRSKKKATIYFDPHFSKTYCTEEEKKAVIAHELGHYEHDTKGSLNAFRRRVLWRIVDYTLLKICCDPTLIEYLEISKKPLAKYVLKQLQNANHLARLEKWNRLAELDADSRMAKAGYGKVFLNFLYNLYGKKEPSSFIEMRIRNLEEKLRV